MVKLTVGLEPTTYSLRMSCATNCATQAHNERFSLLSQGETLCDNKQRKRQPLPFMTNPGIEPGFAP